MWIRFKKRLVGIKISLETLVKTHCNIFVTYLQHIVRSLKSQRDIYIPIHIKIILIRWKTGKVYRDLVLVESTVIYSRCSKKISQCAIGYDGTIVISYRIANCKFNEGKKR